MANSAAARVSPRDGRAPLLGGHDDDMDGSIKRRRIDAGGEGQQLHARSVDPYRAAAEADYGAAEEDYRRSRASGGGPSPRNGSGMYAGHEDQRYGGGSAPNSADRRSVGDESFDSNVPLARRRGDAAQAKASRLHIDTGYGEGSHPSGLYDASRNRLPPYQAPSHGARSAPANKVSFSEREMPSFDPRGEPPPRGYAGPSEAAGAHGAQLPPVYGRRDESALHDANSARRREAAPVQGPSVLSGYRGGPGATPAAPLTATRNAFMPQTATLPSPAYHTTQFVRQAGGAGPPPLTAAGGGAAHGLQAQSAAANHAGGPRTAGLNPPMTARLPEHMRSPPSNKTQFLTLFSNFYESLQDSRTLKVTLEDQVRRSNTLLQTLQKSARVLELTVERRLVAERSLWEGKLNALEERCRRLEQRTGAGSPTPALEDGEGQRGAADEAGDSNENGHAEEGAEKSDQVETSNVEPEDTQAKSDEPTAEAADAKADADKKRRKKA